MNTSMSIPTINVKEAVLEQKNEELINYSKKSRHRLLAAWNDGNKTLVKKLIVTYESVLNRFAKWVGSLDMRSHMIFELGCLQGMVSGISHVLYCEKRQEEADAAFKEQFRYITHLSEIVEILEDKGSLSHTDLSKNLQMKPSTLSEAMKKILVEDVITSTTSGKYRVYSLTDKGIHYAKYLKTLKKQVDLSNAGLIKNMEMKSKIKEKHESLLSNLYDEYVGEQIPINSEKVLLIKMSGIINGKQFSIKAEPGIAEPMRGKYLGNMMNNNENYPMMEELYR